MATRVWSEDECTVGLPGHESHTAAYLRLTGEPFDPKAAAKAEDGGDHTRYVMPNGWEVVVAWPGEASIYRPDEPVAWDAGVTRH